MILSLLALAACLREASIPEGPLAQTPAPQATPQPTEAPTGAPQRSPGSVYALDVSLVDATGASIGLDWGRGHPTLVSMFYTTCPMACPLLIQEVLAVEDLLSPAARAQTRVLLVSMDPANDTPAALADVRVKHGLDPRWALGTPPADRVREVAAVFGVRYRPLPGGGFAHTSVLTLLDGEGHVVAQSEGEAGRAALVDALTRLTTTVGNP